MSLAEFQNNPIAQIAKRNARYAQTADEVRVLLEERAEKGQWPRTEAEIDAPTQEQLETVELTRQTNTVREFLSKVLGFSEDFIESKRIIPDRFPGLLPGQEGILTRPRLIVQPHPTYLLPFTLLQASGVALIP